MAPEQRAGTVGTAAALVAGAVACLSLPALPHWSWFIALLIAGASVFAASAFRRMPNACRYVAVGVFGFSLAGLHAAHAMSQRVLDSPESREAAVVGTIVDLPVVEPRRVRFHFRIDDNATQHPQLRGRLVRLAWYEDRDARHHSVPTAGSRWHFDVRLRAPRGLRNPGGFDTERFALAQRLAATGYVRNGGDAREIAPAGGIHAWRESMSARIDSAVDTPTARFVRALALGDTRDLDDADWSTLRANGLTHLIAISGFHVGLVAGFAALIASLLWRLVPALGLRLPRPIGTAVAAVLGAAVYTAVAGFALPTVRTTLMIAVVAAARCSRRPQSSFAALALAVIAMVLVNPLSLLGAGFWLSVGGVAWLLWCLPAHDAPLLRTFAAAQAVATIGLLPLTVALFGQASIAGPVANLIAVPWWSLVVVPFALIGTALEALQPGWGAWPWRAAAMAFDATWPAFEAVADSGFAFLWLREARWFALPMAALGAFWLLLPRGVPGKPLSLLLWLPLLWPARGLPPHGAFRMDVLDVGQGLSVLVRTASHVVLFDMGPATHDGYDAGERAVIPSLRALGVGTIDVAIVSHADSDHAGGSAAVRRAFPVGDSHAPDGSPTASDGRCVAGRTWRRDGVTFRYLHPPPYFPYMGNEAGCVLRIEGAHGAALLTGDIGEVVERTLARSDPASVRADVVLIPHHGSDGSSDPAFIAVAVPRRQPGDRHGNGRCIAGRRGAGRHDGPSAPPFASSTLGRSAPVGPGRWAMLSASFRAGPGGLNVLELVRAGGWPMIPLLLLSVVALAIIVERFWSLRRKVVLPPGLGAEVRAWAGRGRLDPAHIDSLRSNSPLGALLAAALDVRHRSREEIRERVEDVGRHLVHRMERFLNTLGTIAAAGPLLGLFGTVVGMIQMFLGILDHGVGDVNQLAGGIGKALVCTAAGMVVAVPALCFHRYFRGRIASYIVDMESEAFQLMDALDPRAAATQRPGATPVPAGTPVRAAVD